MRVSNEFLKMKSNKFDRFMFDNYCINNKNDKYIFLQLF